MTSFTTLSNRIVSRSQDPASMEFDLAMADFVATVAAFDPQGISFVAIKRNGEEIEFKSSLTDETLYQGLFILKNSGNNFAASLLQSFHRLSDKQRPWAHFIVNQWLAEQQKAGEDDCDGDHVFAALAAALATVKGRSKTIKLADNVSLHLARCKTKVWVKDPSSVVEDNYGKYGPAFIGTISRDRGISNKIPDDVREEILRFADSI